jgi:hypothetical protein
MTLANAQETNNSKPDQAATSEVAPKVINISPGVAPGSGLKSFTGGWKCSG